jgi:hypothetical protein
MVVESPMPWVLGDLKLRQDLNKLLEISDDLMLSGYPELLRDIFEVFGESFNLFYHGTTMFVYLIGLLEQHVPLLALFVPASSVLLCRVYVSLELIDTLLAVDLTIVGARFDAALVLLDLASATACRHIHNLALIAYHNIKYINL